MNQERRNNDRRGDMRRGDSRRVGARREADANDEFLLPDTDPAFPDVPDFPEPGAVDRGSLSRVLAVIGLALMLVALGIAIAPAVFK